LRKCVTTTHLTLILKRKDNSPLSDDSDPQEEYSPLSVEEYSPQLVEDNPQLSDEISTKENTIDEYIPGIFEDDENQQSPRMEIDKVDIERYRNF
ncbi:hypothetical protein Ddye_028579, partial [Dipteronia dyeriana]